MIRFLRGVGFILSGIILALSLAITWARQPKPQSHTLTYVTYQQNVEINNLILGEQTQQVYQADQLRLLLPNWSPDGRELLFGAYYVSNIQLYRLPRHQLTPLPFASYGFDVWGAVWSPDGTWIAYVSNSGGGNNIYIMRPDGSENRPLTATRDSNFNPTWSPDGQWIAFTSLRDADLELYRVKVDGSETVRITNREGDDSSPAWSPDGEWIAYSSNQNGKLDLFKIRPDGTDNQWLTFTPLVDEYYAAWSPDGRYLAFAHSLDYTTSGLWDLGLIRVDGSDYRNLTNTTPQDEVMPVWYPIIDLPWRASWLFILSLGLWVVVRWTSRYSSATKSSASKESTLGKLISN